MQTRSKRHFKRRAIVALAGGLAILACLVIYFVFLYYEGYPLAERIFGKVLEDLVKDQTLSSLDLKVKVDPKRPHLAVRARVAVMLPPNRRHLLFTLRPDMEILRVMRHDHPLTFRRVKETVYVNLWEPPPENGLVVVDVYYQGKPVGDTWHSIMMPDLVYLDPEDGYYPRQGRARCPVRVEVEASPGLQVVAPVGPSPGGSVSGRTVSFPQPVSSFAVVAHSAAPQVRRMGLVDCVFYSRENVDEDLARSLNEMLSFYQARLPEPDLREFRFIQSSVPLDHGSRYDEAGTVLLSPDLSEEDLAFIMAYFWLKRPFSADQALFGPEEMAKGLALYFLQMRRGTAAYQERLLALSGPNQKDRGPTGWHGGIGSYSVRHRSAKAGPGGYLLSMLRRMVGDRAFEGILRRVLTHSDPGSVEPWRIWNDITRRISGAELAWLFRDWVLKDRELDLALTAFEVQDRPTGQQVYVTIENRGNLTVPEKVQLLIITESGIIRQMLGVRPSRTVFQRFVQDDVIGVVIDPELDWFDTDRSNNFAHLRSKPYLIMPSEDNQHLALAYRKRPQADGYPLVIAGPEGEPLQEISLEAPAVSIQWINDRRFLVHLTPDSASNYRPATHPSVYLIDTLLGQAEPLGPGMEISASESGRYLLLNERRGDRWRHRLKDLDRKMTRSLLNRVPYRLRWLPGTDLILPVYPRDFRGDVLIYSQSGKIAYWFPASDDHLFGFHGFEAGLAFLREKMGAKYFYTIAGPGQEPRLLATLTGEPMGYNISQVGGVIFLRESLPSGALRITSFDPTREEKAILYEGAAEGIYDLFCDKGVLRKAYRNRQGRLHQDIQFHRFGEPEGRFITGSPEGEDVLALVGNQRYLYYTEEIQAPWSALSTFNRYRFFRYDFLSRETKYLDFGAGSP